MTIFFGLSLSLACGRGRATCWETKACLVLLSFAQPCRMHDIVRRLLSYFCDLLLQHWVFCGYFSILNLRSFDCFIMLQWLCIEFAGPLLFHCSDYVWNDMLHQEHTAATELEIVLPKLVSGCCSAHKNQGSQKEKQQSGGCCNWCSSIIWLRVPKDGRTAIWKQVEDWHCGFWKLWTISCTTNDQSRAQGASLLSHWL